MPIDDAQVKKSLREKRRVESHIQYTRRFPPSPPQNLQKTPNARRGERQWQRKVITKQ